MKNQVWRLTAAALMMGGIIGAVGCNSCQGTNINADNSNATLTSVCGPGTQLVNTDGNPQCVPI